jgi:DNA-binding IclR family transcriptional regulator
MAKESNKLELQGVQNVEIGLRIAMSLADAKGAMTLGELALATGIYPSKVHRYLVSLCRAGLLEQDGRTGRYDLGPQALFLGLAAQGRLDKFRLADEVMETLHAQTEATISAAVWANHGPTIVGRKEALRAVTINTHIGSVIPVTTSAAGRLYAAYLPAETVLPFIDAEAAQELPLRFMGNLISSDDFFPIIIEEIRHSGVSCVKGDHMMGIDAIAVPVFNQQGQLTMTLTVLGPQGSLNLDPDGETMQAVRDAGDTLSRRLGYRHLPQRNAARPRQP